MRKALVLIFGIGATITVAAASGDGVAHRTVADHRFAIPNEYLFDATISWSPAAENDSFAFLLQPNPNPNEIPEHRVLVERLSRFCPVKTDDDAVQMLRIACGEEKPRVSDAPPYEKMSNELGSWSSDLFAVRKQPGKNGVVEKRKVADCQTFEPNPAKPTASTLCTTFWAYKGMKLQFSFDEKEASDMPVMKAKAEALLDQWELR